MSYYRYRENSDYGLGYIFPRPFRGGIKTIIITNAIVFLIMAVFGLAGPFSRVFGLVPKYVWSRFYIWQLFTYMFIHGGFWHVFWNMFVLWMFGMEIEYYWGRREFLRYYFVTGVGAGLITMLFSLKSTIPVVGASGAIFGILLAFALTFPERYIFIYFLIPIKAKYFVIIIGLITFFSSLSPGYSNVSHLTHLGGLLVGYLYLKREYLIRNIRYKISNLKIEIPRRKKRVKRDGSKWKGYDTDETLREEVDRILDKIAKDGFDSLTEEEKRTLYLASSYFADRNGRSGYKP